MKYLNTLNDGQKINLNHILNAIRNAKISNKFSIAAILAVVSKESNFNLNPEKSYANTANDRIRKIFGLRLKKYTEEGLSALKKNPEAFFEAVYGPETVVGKQNGNTSKGDGWKYRGRGFNGITFFNSYRKIGKQIGIDLVNNPEKLNDPVIAAKALVQYFINAFNACPVERMKHYNTTGLNGFLILDDAVKAVYHSNAGWGKDYAKLEADPTGGRKKALARAPEFLEIA